MKDYFRVIMPGCILLVARSDFAQVNWRTSAAFADYRTYAWKAGKFQRAYSYRRRVVKDVDAELAHKGLRRVMADEDPDLYIYYHLVSQELVDSRTIDDGFGWGGGPWSFWKGWGGREFWRGMGPDTSQTEAQPRMRGMLAVDLVDVKKKELVWRGQATVDSISKTQKRKVKQVLDSVKKMFKQYPPEEKWTSDRESGLGPEGRTLEPSSTVLADPALLY